MHSDSPLDTGTTALRSGSCTVMRDFTLEARSYHNKSFEFFKNCATITSKGEPIFLPYGIEVENRFTGRPVFAGGTEDRNYVNIQVSLGDEMADAIRNAEAAFDQKTTFKGEWAPSVIDKNGRRMFKCRLQVCGANNLSYFRHNIEGELRSGWAALEGMLGFDLRGARGRLAVQPSKIWKVQGNVGVTWRVLQLDVEPSTQEVKDHFADAY